MNETPNEIPGETYFFRDQGQFSLLRERILPTLIEEKIKAQTLRLRLWSAGCSSGEEAYSLAIVIDTLLPNRAAWNIAIVATDANERLLEKARRGLYRPWSFRMMDADLLRRHFEDRDGQWELSHRIRGMVDFRQGDLLTEKLPSVRSGLFEMDLIVCRNVLIYFQDSQVQNIGKTMTETLRQGGYLVTGHGELRGNRFQGLKSITFPQSVVYQRAPHNQQPVSVPPLADGRPKPKPKIKVTGSEDPAVLHESAGRAASLGNYDEAVQWCERVLAVDCFSAKTYYLLAHIAEERGETETAKEMLKKVLYLDAHFVPAYIELAGIYASHNDVRRARKMRDAALQFLEQIPPGSTFDTYGGLTAAELIPQVRTMIGQG